MLGNALPQFLIRYNSAFRNNVTFTVLTQMFFTKKVSRLRHTKEINELRCSIKEFWLQLTFSLHGCLTSVTLLTPV